MPAPALSLLLLPVLVWAAAGLGLVGAFRAGRPVLVHRLAAVFLALWSLLATSALAWVVGNGGYRAPLELACSPGSALALFGAAGVPMWIDGAMGAFAIFLAAFLVNQLAARAVLHLAQPVPIPWPSGVPPPHAQVMLVGSSSLVPDAATFALLRLTRAGPRRVEVIVVSRGLREILTEEELASVVAHELGHVGDLDGRYLTFLRTLANLFRWDPLFALVASRLTRREEFRADDAAVRSTGRPMALARALFKASLAHPGPLGRVGSVGLLGRRGDRGRRETLDRIRRLVAMAEAAASPEGPGA